jgi:hypothetical protein
MDVLSDVLKAVRLTGAVFFERHLHAPWVGESPPSAAIASMVMPDADHSLASMQSYLALAGPDWPVAPTPASASAQATLSSTRWVMPMS